MDHSPLPRPSRLLALSVSALLLTVGLAACGDDDEPTASAGDGGTTAPDNSDSDYGSGGGDTGGEAGESVVVAKDFSLTDLTVEPGEEFTLDNQGENPHTLTADDGAFDSGEVEAGAQSDPLTPPDEPGDYAFHCEIHDSMTGTLTVEG